MWFDTILWLVAIVAFIAVETATTALVSVWFAIGAAAAMFASFFTSSLGIQAAVFAVVSAVALAIMVPTLTRRRKEHKPPVTNGSPLTIGKQGIVLVAIEPGMPGRVRVDGKRKVESLVHNARTKSFPVAAMNLSMSSNSFFWVTLAYRCVIFTSL